MNTQPLHTDEGILTMSIDDFLFAPAVWTFSPLTRCGGVPDLWWVEAGFICILQPILLPSAPDGEPSTFGRRGVLRIFGTC